MTYGRIGGSTVGNLSKRGRHDPHAPDPVTEWQEGSRWGGYAWHIRGPFLAGNRVGSPTRSSMPAGARWLGIATPGPGVLGAVWLLFWLLSAILP